MREGEKGWKVKVRENVTAGCTVFSKTYMEYVVFHCTGITKFEMTMEVPLFVHPD